MERTYKYFVTAQDRDRYTRDLHQILFPSIAGVTCECGERRYGLDVFDRETKAYRETLVVCHACYVRQRVKEHTFRTEVQSKIERGKRLTKSDMTFEISRVDYTSILDLYKDLYSRETIVRDFNKIFGTNIK